MGRREDGGRIDRSQRLGFQFNGRAMTGFAGDTLASALVANDVRIVGRSFKYHRPRGIFGAGEEEPNAVVQLGEGAWSEPNLKATQVELYDGLVARSVNCWPSASFDLGAVVDLAHQFLPAGFYYKTFMGGPGWAFWEHFVRRAAGLGVAPGGADPDSYLKRHAHCDVLVIGAGQAGLAAALTAARTGAEVILLDDQNEPGGALLWSEGRVEGVPGMDWVAQVVSSLAEGSVRRLARTTAFGIYDHNHVMALERVADHLAPAARGGCPRQRLWSIRPREVVVATGAIERPLVFPDNDRPGVMLASAAQQYAVRYAALAGRRALLFANNDAAYVGAERLIAAGIAMAAVVDPRTEPGPAAAALRARGVTVHAGSEIARVEGGRGVHSVQVAPAGVWVSVDAVLASGGWNPTAHLFSQAGGRLRWREDLACFAPGGEVAGLRVVGAAAGDFGPEPWRIQPFWQGRATRRRQWVDLQSDVTVQDVELAARENLVSVEHLKRYTTTGMATDQGKTSNVNALALLGAATGRAPGEVGTTRFRPPYTPVSMSAVAGGASGDLFTPRRMVPAEAAHRELGAVFEDFGRWQRPDFYPRGGESREAAARREHRAVREAVGLFESTPIGKIAVTGADAAWFLNMIYANRVDNLQVGRIRYGLMLNENGIVSDDGVCARVSEREFLLCPTSGATGRIAAMLEEWRQCEYPHLDIHVADLTTVRAAFAVAGPQARVLMQRLNGDIDFSPEAFAFMTFRDGLLEGVPARVMRVSFSGELQFEIQLPWSYGETMWRRLMALGADLGIVPVGIEAWLRLRMEKGFVHVGSDTDGTTTPDDLGFGPALARKQADFVGRRSLSRSATARADRAQFVGLRRVDSDLPLPVGGCVFTGERFAPPVLNEGRVTSSCFSPLLGRPVALGLVLRGRARMGEIVSVFANGAVCRAEICAPVAYDPENGRARG